MKLKNYERSYFLTLLVILFLVLELILVGCTCFIKINDYYVISGSIRRSNLVEMVVDDEALDIINSNGNYFYIDDKKIKIKNKQVIKDVLVDNKKKYHDVLINCQVKGKKDNDIVRIVFRKKQISLSEIFKVIKDGD